MENQKFCTKCGANIQEGSAFCVECGAPVDGGTTPPSGQDMRAMAMMYGRPTLLLALYLIYGVLATIIGAMDTFTYMNMKESDYQSMIDTVKSTYGAYWDMLKDYFPEWSDSLHTKMVVSQACIMISGIFALCTYYMCKKGNGWKIAIVLSLAASVSCLGMCVMSMEMPMAILMFVVGMVLTYILYGKRSLVFKDAQ